MTPPSPEIDRGRTALSRTALSRPVERAVFDGFIHEEATFFDYGCGRGDDLKRIGELGAIAHGYDPVHAPDADLVPSDVVNLGFVVNVIEDPDERAQVLARAWSLAESLLIVSGRLHDEARGLEGTPHADGILTERGTFQKFYDQNELRTWISEVLEVEPVAAEPGVFYLFRNRADAELYRLTRVTRSRPAPVRSEIVFEQHEELLNSLIEFYEERGRLPRTGEWPNESELREKVGTVKQAFRVIQNLTEEERWDRIRLARYEDLLVYLALSEFHRRPKMSELPTYLQADIKDFFGSYKAAREQGKRALLAIADQERIKDAIRAAPVGKKLPRALYIHVSAMGTLPTSLRILDGCARELLGTIANATIVKFDSEKPRVVYLEYPAFDTEAHPALEGAYSVNLRTLHTDYASFSKRTNPPILHRKELFVRNDYPHRHQFATLTRHEEEAGLYTDPSRIGLRDGWASVLETAGVSIIGHSLRC